MEKQNPENGDILQPLHSELMNHPDLNLNYGQVVKIKKIILNHLIQCNSEHHIHPEYANDQRAIDDAEYSNHRNIAELIQKEKLAYVITEQPKIIGQYQMKDKSIQHTIFVWKAKK